MNPLRRLQEAHLAQYEEPADLTPRARDYQAILKRLAVFGTAVGMMGVLAIPNPDPHARLEAPGTLFDRVADGLSDMIEPLTQSPWERGRKSFRSVYPAATGQRHLQALPPPDVHIEPDTPKGAELEQIGEALGQALEEEAEAGVREAHRYSVMSR